MCITVRDERVSGNGNLAFLFGETKNIRKMAKKQKPQR